MNLHVFKTIEIDNQLMYILYRLPTKEELENGFHIVEDETLTPEDYFKRLKDWYVKDR